MSAPHKINEGLIVSMTVPNLDGRLIPTRHLDAVGGGGRIRQGLVNQVLLRHITNWCISAIEAPLCLIVTECGWHCLVLRHLEGCRQQTWGCLDKGLE